MKTQKRDTNGRVQFKWITHEKSELPLKFSEMTQDKYSSMYILVLHRCFWGFLGGLVVKESACSAGDAGL